MTMTRIADAIEKVDMAHVECPFSRVYRGAQPDAGKPCPVCGMTSDGLGGYCEISRAEHIAIEEIRRWVPE